MAEFLIITKGFFDLFICAMVVAFGVPYSISDTFYLMNAKKRNLGYLFTVWAALTGIAVAAMMFELSVGQWYQFLGLFAGGALGFVGAAPLFKGHEKKIHYTAAGVCAVAAVVWMVATGYWFVPATTLATCGVITMLTKTRKYMFWFEVVMFVSMFFVIYCEIRN
jgi:hypothetical protein